MVSFYFNVLSLNKQRASLFPEVLDFFIQHTLFYSELFRKAAFAQKRRAAPVDKFPVSSPIQLGQLLPAFYTGVHYRSTTLQRYTAQP